MSNTNYYCGNFTRIGVAGRRKGIKQGVIKLVDTLSLPEEID